MNKTTKTICLTAAAMVAVGLILSGIGLMLGADISVRGPLNRLPIFYGNSWDVDEEEALFAADMERIAESTEAFSSIDLNLDLQVVEFEESDSFGIDCIYNPKYSSVTYGVENGVLRFEENAKNNMGYGLDWLGDENRRGRLLIKYPAGTEFDFITADSDMSSISIENLAVKSLEVNADMGAVELDGITCETAVINCDMGAIEANDFICTKSFESTAAMGGVEIQGDLRGVVRMDCDMGAISLVLAGRQEEYSYDVSTELGSVEINGKESRNTVYRGGENMLYINCSMGGAEIYFNEN